MKARKKLQNYTDKEHTVGASLQGCRVMKEKARDSVALGQEKIEKMKELLLKLSLRNTEFYKYIGLQEIY